MAADERDRLNLYDRLGEVLGLDAAGTLMELLPPNGWDDIATKSFVAAEAKALRGEMAEVRGEMAELRSEVRGEIALVRGEMAELRSEVRGEIALVRGEMAELRSEVTGAIVGLRADLRVEVAGMTRTLMLTMFGFMLTIWLTLIFA